MYIIIYMYPMSKCIPAHEWSSCQCTPANEWSSCQAFYFSWHTFLVEYLLLRILLIKSGTSLLPILRNNINSIPIFSNNGILLCTAPCYRLHSAWNKVASYLQLLSPTTTFTVMSHSYDIIAAAIAAAIAATIAAAIAAAIAAKIGVSVTITD